MSLIGISILIGIVGYLIAGAIGGESLALIGGILGILSPGLFVLEQIYNEIKKSK
jgi:uncharacterized membrane protein